MVAHAARSSGREPVGEAAAGLAERHHVRLFLFDQRGELLDVGLALEGVEGEDRERRAAGGHRIGHQAWHEHRGAHEQHQNHAVDERQHTPFEHHDHEQQHEQSRDPDEIHGRNGMSCTNGLRRSSPNSTSGRAITATMRVKTTAQRAQGVSAARARKEPMADPAVVLGPCRRSGGALIGTECALDRLRAD